METKSRSFIKSIIWRIIALISSFTIAKLLGLESVLAAKMTIYANSAGMVLYYIHERVWSKISFGIQNDKD